MPTTGLFKGKVIEDPDTLLIDLSSLIMGWRAAADSIERDGGSARVIRGNADALERDVSESLAEADA